MRKVIRVSNIDCASCAMTIESHFNEIDNMKATVSVPAKKVIFEYTDSIWNEEKIASELRKIGYYALLTPKEVKRKKIIDLIDLILAAFLSVPLLYAMLGHVIGNTGIAPSFIYEGIFQFIISGIVLFFCGRRFFINTFNQIKNLNLGMDTLVILGTLSAYIYSFYLAVININVIQSHIHYFFEPASTIVTMVLLGNILESRVREKTSDTLSALVSLESKEALIIIDGKEILTPIDNVKINDIVVVKALETIPIDGIITNGSTYVDEQTMTGESMPKKKGIGDIVYASTNNLVNTIHLKVTADTNDTELAKIIKTVEDTAKIKPKAQRTADKIAKIFVPAVVMIAIITFLIWFFGLNSTFEESVSAFVSVLVISCPCALGLATPTSISVSSGIAFKEGILFKGGEFFEVTPKINAICFDKTGTLTKGEPAVTDYFGDELALKITASIEKHSNHPLAKAVLDYYNSEEYLEIKDFKVEIGSGLSGIIDGKEIMIGSKKTVDKLNLSVPFAEYESLINEGKTVFFTIYDNKIISMIAAKDMVNDNALSVINELKSRGITPYLLTGDNKVTSTIIAKNLSFENFYSELLPVNKKEIIENLQKEGKVVAFVGDGVNDSPAMKAADVSFSVKNANDIAIGAADVSLLKNDLTLIIRSYELSKKTLSNIYQNFFWAFIYNVVMIPLAATAILTPTLSGIGMGFSSIMVVLNALRLKLIKFKKI